MKRLLAILFLACSLQAADVTITITIPDSRVAEIQAALTAWRAKQKKDDGTPKYPTQASLLRALVIDGIQRILDQEPSAAMAIEQAKIDAAKAQMETLKTTAAQ